MKNIRALECCWWKRVCAVRNLLWEPDAADPHQMPDSHILLSPLRTASSLLAADGAAQVENWGSTSPETWRLTSCSAHHVRLLGTFGINYTREETSEMMREVPDWSWAKCRSVCQGSWWGLIREGGRPEAMMAVFTVSALMEERWKEWRYSSLTVFSRHSVWRYLSLSLLLLSLPAAFFLSSFLLCFLPLHTFFSAPHVRL